MRAPFQTLAGFCLLAPAAPHRRDRTPLERRLAAMDRAAGSGDFPAALAANRRAQTLAPHDARLRTDEAYFLSRVGDLEGALRAYETASDLTRDGEPRFLAAALALESGRPLEEAERLALDAILRTPALGLEMVDDPLFAPLRSRPSFEAALQAALRRARS